MDTSGLVDKLKKKSQKSITEFGETTDDRHDQNCYCHNCIKKRILKGEKHSEVMCDMCGTEVYDPDDIPDDSAE